MQTPTTPILDDDNTEPGELSAAAWSETGLHHPNNEDSFRIVLNTPQAQFCGVSDGVGGGSMGDLASATLMDYCKQLDNTTLQDPPKLSQWFAAADAVVQRKLAGLSNKPGAATMVGVWFLSPEQIRVIHVGDCRLYRLNPTNWQLQQLTVDQTYGKLGDPPPNGGSPDDPARMVGVGAIGTPEITNHKLQAGEYLLLCSDGLHKFLNDQAMAQLIQQGITQQLELKAICQNLVRAAKQAGSHDDVTALLIQRHIHRSTALVWWLIALILLLIVGLLAFKLMY